MWVYGVRGGVGTDALMLLHACSSSTLRISHLDQLQHFGLCGSINKNENLTFFCFFFIFFYFFIFLIFNFFLEKIKRRKKNNLI